MPNLETTGTQEAAEASATVKGRVEHAARRRSFLVDRRFQLRVTALLAGSGGFAALVPVLALWYEHQRCEALALSCGREVSWGLIPFSVWFAAWVLGVVMVLAVAGVVLTHRVAGPELYLKRLLREIGEGRRPQLRPLRDGDELRGLFAAVKDLDEQLEAREREELAHLEVVVNALEEGETQLAKVALRALSEEKKIRIEP